MDCFILNLSDLTYSPHHHICNYLSVNCIWPVTVAERSEACTVFARSEAGIVGVNPTQAIDIWCVYVFILCVVLCCPVFRSCDELITRPRSPTVCKNDQESEKQRSGPKRGCRTSEKNCF
jgi:hypothetical protein